MRAGNLVRRQLRFHVHGAERPTNIQALHFQRHDELHVFNSASGFGRIVFPRRNNIMVHQFVHATVCAERIENEWEDIDARRAAWRILHSSALIGVHDFTQVKLDLPKKAGDSQLHPVNILQSYHPRRSNKKRKSIWIDPEHGRLQIVLVLHGLAGAW